MARTEAITNFLTLRSKKVKYQLKLQAEGEAPKVLDLFGTRPKRDVFVESICHWKTYELFLIVQDDAALKDFPYTGCEGTIEVNDEDSCLIGFNVMNGSRFNEFKLDLYEKCKPFNEMYGSLRFRINLKQKNRGLELYTRPVEGRVKREQKVALESIATEQR